MSFINQDESRLSLNQKNDPKHEIIDRYLYLLIPLLCLLCYSAGILSLIILSIGICGLYISHYMNIDIYYQVFITWLFLLIFMVYINVIGFNHEQSRIFTIFLLFHINWSIALIGMYITKLYPLLSHFYKQILEKIIDITLPLTCSSLFMSFIISINGLDNSQYILIVLLYLTYSIISPLHHKIPKLCLFILFIVYISLPTLYYYILERNLQWDIIQKCNFQLLITLSLTSLFYSNNYQHVLISWLNLNQFKAIQRPIMFILIAWNVYLFEQRVLYYSFISYWYYADQYPILSHLLIIIGLYTLFLSIYLLLSSSLSFNIHDISLLTVNKNKKSLSSSNILHHISIFLTISILCWSIALGLSWFMILLIVLCSIFIFYALKKQHSIYLSISLLCSCYLLYLYIKHQILYIKTNDFIIPLTSIHISLHMLCIIIIISILCIGFTFICFYIYFTATNTIMRNTRITIQFIMNILFFIYSLLFLLIELIMHQANIYHKRDMYPNYLIILTSMMMYKIISHSYIQKIVYPILLDSILSLYMAKLAILVYNHAYEVKILKIIFIYWCLFMCIKLTINMNQMLKKKNLYLLSLISIYSIILLYNSSLLLPFSLSFILRSIINLILIFSYILWIIYQQTTKISKFISILLIMSIIYSIIDYALDTTTSGIIYLFIALTLLISSIIFILPFPRTIISCLIATLLAIYINVQYIPYNLIAYFIIICLLNLVTLIILKIYDYGLILTNNSKYYYHQNIHQNIHQGTMYLYYVLFIISHFFISLLMKYLYNPHLELYSSLLSTKHDNLYEMLMILQYIYSICHFIIALLCKLFYPSLLGNYSVIITFLYGVYLANNMNDLSIYILSPLLLLLSDIKGGKQVPYHHFWILLGSLT